MDRIIVFDQGKIVQDGNHAQLLMEEGLYKKLWSAQVGGFLPDQLKKEE
jgi:ATP-binding cassette subfamily B protein